MKNCPHVQYIVYCKYYIQILLNLNVYFSNTCGFHSFQQNTFYKRQMFYISLLNDIFISALIRGIWNKDLFTTLETYFCQMLFLTL